MYSHRVSIALLAASAHQSMAFSDGTSIDDKCTFKIIRDMPGTVVEELGIEMTAEEQDGKFRLTFSPGETTEVNGVFCYGEDVAPSEEDDREDLGPFGAFEELPDELTNSADGLCEGKAVIHKDGSPIDVASLEFVFDPQGETIGEDMGVRCAFLVDGKWDKVKASLINDSVDDEALEDLEDELDDDLDVDIDDIEEELDDLDDDIEEELGDLDDDIDDELSDIDDELRGIEDELEDDEIDVNGVESVEDLLGLNQLPELPEPNEAGELGRLLGEQLARIGENGNGLDAIKDEDADEGLEELDDLAEEEDEAPLDDLSLEDDAEEEPLADIDDESDENDDDSQAENVDLDLLEDDEFDVEEDSEDGELDLEADSEEDLDEDASLLAVDEANGNGELRQLAAMAFNSASNGLKVDAILVSLFAIALL